MKPLTVVLGLAVTAAFVAHARRARAAENSPKGGPGDSPHPAPPRTGPAAPSATPAAPAAPATGSSLVYRSPGGSVSPRGWVPLPGAEGREVTAEPLLDPSGATRYARLGYRAASELAAQLGARLPTETEAKALHAGGVLLEPCTLPGSRMAEVAAVHRERGWPSPVAGDRRMGSLEWARIHDDCVAAQIAKAGAEGSAFANAGKLWLKGAKPGKAINFGWLQNGKFIQNPGGVHDDQHTDYSQLITLVREAKS